MTTIQTMSTKQKLLVPLSLGLLLFATVLPMLACGADNSANTQGINSVIAPGGDAIANEAVNLENHLFGVRSNMYNSAEIPKEVAYWSSLCAIGTPCWNDLFAPGSLQCVSFVTGVFAAIGDPLPAQGNAVEFWDLYANRPGWQEIPNGQDDPEIGDIVVWSKDSDPNGEPGHVAVVVGTNPPSATQAGSVTVGQANGPGNTPGVASGSPGNFYTMTWGGINRYRPSGYVSTWPGYTILGFIRQTSGRPAVTPVTIPQDLSKVKGLPPLTSAQTKWALLALQAAVHYQLPIPTRFVIQLNNESGLNPDVGNSSAGAVGIAQFLPSTAQSIPGCAANLNVNNPPNCMGEGSLDPKNPTQAIGGAAYYMYRLYTHYLNYTSNSDQAYAYAVAGYNAGQGTIDNALTNCKASQWTQCLPTETSKYVNCIMGYDKTQCNFKW